VIYLDSSALLKLLFEEPESAALEEWISERAGTPVSTSELARVEAVRATRRLDPDALPAARALVGQLDLIRLTSAVIQDAAEAGDPLLPTLDALHLASALSIRSYLSAFVAYDHRVLAAAAAAGLEPLRPGS
jgi:uncharacterized protein